MGSEAEAAEEDTFDPDASAPADDAVIEDSAEYE
jgi:hypothetical protein